MPIRVEVKDQKGQTCSVLELHSGDTYSHPLVPRRPFTEELLIVFPSGGFSRSTRFSFGRFKGDWEWVNGLINKGEQQSYAIPPQSRLIIKNI